MKSIILKRILLAGLITCIMAGNSANCFAAEEEEIPQTANEEITENIEGTPAEESFVGLLSESTPELSLQSGTASAYTLVGIENGDIVITNEELGKMVYVVDDTAKAELDVVVGKGFEVSGFAAGKATYVNPDTYAAGIEKVIYYINGEMTATVTEAPYAAELDIKSLGDNTLVAEIYDTAGNVTTIERSFKASYGNTAKSYNENFDGENTVIPETMITKFPNITWSNSTSVNNAQRVQTIEAFNGSLALKVNPGNGYTYADCVGTKNKNHSNIGLWPEALDVTAGTSRVFLEFDYSADRYSHGIDTICLQNAFKLSDGSNGDYGAVKLPKNLLQGPAKNSFKTTRIGLDISWNNVKDEISYKLFLNGKESYRLTTNILYSNEVDPAKLTPVLSGCGNQLINYIDNIRVVAYNEVNPEGVVLGDPTITMYGDDDAEISGTTGINTGLNYFTVDVPGGTDIKTLPGNITLRDDTTGENVELIVENEKIRVLEQLIPGSSYTILVGSMVKNAAGKNMLGEKTLTLTTNTGTLCVDRSETGFAESELPAAGGTVTFNAKLKGSNVVGKTVTVVCAVYNGSKMADATVIAQRTSDSLGNLPAVTVTLAEVTENTVVEAFVVNNTIDLSPISYEVYSLN